MREIVIDARGRATGAVYYDHNGMAHQVTARVVVLGCNRIGTPRLLLNSSSSAFPNGLANSSGQVGRNLMFHPVSFVSGVFNEPVNGQQGPIGGLLHCQEFYETDVSRGFVRGFELQLTRNVGPLTLANGGLISEAVPWGTNHHRVLRERLAHTLTTTVMIEDLPEPHNRVTLDASLTDNDGIPAPKIAYRLSDNSRAGLDFAIERAREPFEAIGAHTVLADPLTRESGWHLLGTARMGDDPETSVVDRWGRAHDLPNLFIVDGSVFVTCAAINPTSTIQALALRSADWLARHHRELAA